MPRHHRLSWVALVVLGGTLLNSACGGGSPTSPTPPSGGTPAPPATDPVNLTATWSGTASDSSGPGQVTWQITQSGTSFSGTLVMTDAATGYGGRGAVSGTMTGSSIRFSMSVPAGGFDGPHGACTANVSGDGQATSSSITGTYSGSNSCSGTIASGQLTLNKQ